MILSRCLDGLPVEEHVQMIAGTELLRQAPRRAHTETTGPGATRRRRRSAMRVLRADRSPAATTQEESPE